MKESRVTALFKNDFPDPFTHILVPVLFNFVVITKLGIDADIIINLIPWGCLVTICCVGCTLLCFLLSKITSISVYNKLGLETRSNDGLHPDARRGARRGPATKMEADRSAPSIRAGPDPAH